MDILCVQFVLPLPQMAMTFLHVTCRCSHCGIDGKLQCWYSMSEGRLQLGLWASVVLLGLSPALENEGDEDERSLKFK